MSKSINESISGEDKALLRCLYEEYGYNTVSNYINEKYWFDPEHPDSTAGSTPGTTEHGVKGLVKALPGFAIEFLVCPPAAIISMIGALHTRAEKRWLKSIINPNRLPDFISLPNERKKEIADKVKRDMARETSYYIATLANGEILRVVACTTMEAKEMVLGLEEKIIIPQEKEFKILNDPNNAPQDSKLWRVLFNDGEVCYWEGSEDAKERIVKSAYAQRLEIAKAFEKQFEVVTKKYTGKTEHLNGIGNSMDDEKIPIKVATIDDAVILREISDSYVPITDANKEDFTIIKAETISTHFNDNYPLYQITIPDNLGNTFMEFHIPAKDETELNKIVKEIFNNTGTAGNIMQEMNTLEAAKNSSSISSNGYNLYNNVLPYVYVTFTLANKDKITLFMNYDIIDPYNQNASNLSGASTNSIEQRKKQVINNLYTNHIKKIESYIYLAVKRVASKETVIEYEKHNKDCSIVGMQSWHDDWGMNNSSTQDHVDYRHLFDNIPGLKVDKYNYSSKQYEQTQYSLAI